MSAVKKTVTAIISVAAVAAIGFTGYKLWNKQAKASAMGTVYVTQVSELNTVSAPSLSGSRFNGVIESQKTDDYNFDRSKEIKSIEVAVGDEVKEGDVLFTYDAEAMRLELEQAKIEVERMENEIETYKLQIEDLEKEKAKTPADGQTALNTQILALQSDVAKGEYDVKAQKSKNKKLKSSIKNAQVTAKTDGIVKSVADIDMLEYAESNVVVSISKGGNYRVKGTVNEQLIGTIYESMPVTIHSRIDDDAVWTGYISSIETEPQNNNDDMYYYDGDSSMRSTKYSFYVEPDTLEGLMLGQHIIIEPDRGDGEETITKTGIWLYSDFVFDEDGKTYVWADNGKNRIEKREVTIGQSDDFSGDCEIVSGLELDDRIAYPSKEIVEGMAVTDDAEEADIPEEDYSDMGGMGDEFYGDDFYDDGFYDDGFYDDGFMDGEFMDGEFVDGEFMDGEYPEEGFDGEDITGDEYPEDIGGQEPEFE